MSRNGDRGGGGGGQVSNKVYVGNLTRDASRDEIERAFGHYGKLRNVFVARNPPGFAFVEFEDHQDAEDSVRGLDGRNLCGVRVRVEISHGKSRNKGGMRGGGGRDRGGGGPYRRRSRTRSRSRSRTRSRSYERDRRRKGSHSRSSSRDRSDRYNRDTARESNGRRKPVARSRSRSRS